MWLENEVMALVAMCENLYNEETGQIENDDENILQGLAQEQIAPQMEKYVNASKYYESQAEMLADEIKRLQARKKSYENKASHLKNRVLSALRILGGKFKTTCMTFSIRKTKSINIADTIDWRDVPEQFVITKHDYNKAELKKYLMENDVTIKGVTIEEREGLATR